MRLRTRSIIIMLSQGLTQATTIVLGIILVRLISQQTFGTYRQVDLVYLFLAGVISLQLHSSLYYFIPKLGAELRRTLLLQTFLVTGAAALVTAAVMFLGAGYIARLFHNPELVPLLRILCLLPFADRLVILIPAFMISMDRAVRAGTYSLIAATSRIAVVVIMFAVGFDLPAVMWSIVAVCGVVALVGCADMVRLCPAGEWRLVRGILRQQIGYSWPLLATAVVGTINLQLNKLLISMFFGPEAYAVYSCGAMQLPVVGLITTSLSIAMMPELVAMAADGRMQQALHTWQEAARKSSLVIFPCFVFFLGCGYDLMVLLYGQEYSQASWPFRVYLCSLPVKVAIYATLFRAAGHTRSIAVAALIALIVNMAVSTTLVIVGGGGLLSFIGPTLGMVVASWCSWSFLLWQLTHITGVQLSRIMRWKELGQVLLVGVVCGLVVFAVPLPAAPLIVTLAVQGVLYVVVFLGVMLLAGMLKEDEKEMLSWPVLVVRRWRHRRD